jgi:hypothetical protein
VADIKFVRCPKCQSQYWFDIPNPDKPERTHWRCFRCSYQIVLGACAGCMKKEWKMTRGIDPKGGHRPFYRFECQGCKRVLGFLVYS